MADLVGRTITPDEADNAIYIDFEGRQGEPPVLLGSLYAEGQKRPDQDRLILRHDILDDSLRSLHEEVPVTPITFAEYRTEVRSLRATYADLIGRAHKQDRLIVAWSRHELTASLSDPSISDHVRDELLERFRDGKETAKRWLRATQPDMRFEPDERKRRNTLARYLELTGYEVPNDFVGGSVGSGIKQVRQGLQRGDGTWDDLTVGQRRAWWRILGHNLHDCLGLRHVVRIAAYGMESISPGRCPQRTRRSLVNLSRPGATDFPGGGTRFP